MILAAVSDLVLAAVCVTLASLRLAKPPRNGRTLMVTGWIMLGLAALGGALRYGLLPELATLHRGLSDVAAAVGLPAVVLGLLLGWRTSMLRTEALLLAALVAIAAGGALAEQLRLPGTVVTLVAALAATLVTSAAARGYSVTGLLALLASAGFATQLPREGAVAGLHLALAVAQIAWCRAALLAPRMESTQASR